MSTEIDIEDIAIKSVKLHLANQIGQAAQHSVKVLETVKKQPQYLKNIRENGLLGKSFLLMLEQDLSSDQSDLQLIIELSYFFLSKALKTEYNKPQYILDRLTLLFNGEDYLKETIKNALNIKVSILSPMNSPHMTSYELEEYLDRMRIADLENKNAIYTHIKFLLEKRKEFDQLITEEYFGVNKSKQDIILSGEDLHEKVFNYIQKKI